MKRIALLEYTFMFDPDATWQSGSAFERDLADFFAAHGREANWIETTGNGARRILYIQKIDESQLNPPKATKLNFNKDIKK